MSVVTVTVESGAQRTVEIAHAACEWKCSDAQASVVFADDDEHVLMVCGEGAGGTYAAAMRAIRYACEHPGAEVGIGWGPLGIDAVGSVLAHLCPAPNVIRVGKQSITLANGSRIARGRMWSFKATTVAVILPFDLSDIGRPGWALPTRTLLTVADVSTEPLVTGPFSRVVRVPSTSNPFVRPDHWANARTLMSEREYRRRVLAEAGT